MNMNTYYTEYRIARNKREAAERRAAHITIWVCIFTGATWAICAAFVSYALITGGV